MPKKSLTLSQFHGGVNSSASKRDVADNELTSAQNIMVDELGKIRTIGSNTTYSNFPSSSATFSSGHGLMHAAYDYTLFTKFSVSPLEGDLAPGDKIYGRASGAVGTVVNEYQNTVWVSSVKTGLRIPSGTINYARIHRNFIYYTKVYNLTSGSVAVKSVENGNYDKHLTCQYYFPYKTSSTDFKNVYDDDAQGIQGTNDGALAIFGTGIPNSVQQTYVNSVTNYNANDDAEVFSFHNNHTNTVATSSGDEPLTFKEVIVTENHIRGVVTNITATNITGTLVNGTYTGIGTTGGDGQYLTLDIVVSGGSITSMKAHTGSSGPGGNIGIGYKKGNVITIAAGSWNGSESGSTATINHCGFRGYVNSNITYSSAGSSDVYFLQDNADINIYSSGMGNLWGSGLISLGTDTTDVKPVSYTVDGKIRIADSNFNNENNTIKTLFFSNDTKRLGYSNYGNNQKNSGSSIDITGGWVLTDSERKAPNVSYCSFNEDSALPTDDAWSGKIDGSIRISMAEDAGDGVGWQDADGTVWYCALSFIYEDGQESDLTAIGNHNFNSGNTDRKHGIQFEIYMNSFTGKNSCIPEGVEKIGIYLAKDDTSNYFFQGDAHLNDGLKWLGYGERYPWLYMSTFGSYYQLFRDNTSNTWLTSPNMTMTYKDRTGRDEGDVTAVQGFKSAVVANRQVYLGNVKIDGVSYGDRIIKSEVNEPDIFSKDRVLEASVNDGDEIVALETYADRILEFKRNKINIINVSQSIEFLEDTSFFKGIKNTTCVCKTDFGIAWINEHGCYLYDGRSIQNLLEKKGRQIINESLWATFITDNSSIGYFPRKRQIIVIKDVTASSAGDMYLFDIVTQSWVTGDSVFLDSKKQTNFIHDSSGELIHYTSDGTFLKWTNDSAAHGKVDISTKALAFTSPSQRKKIYSVYVTHKNAGTNKFKLYGEFHSRSATSGQGAGELSTEFDCGFFVEDSGTASNYITQKFTFPATDLSSNSISFNNVYSIKFNITNYKEFNGSTILNETSNAGFAINDISIVYRLKGIS